jgi:NAD(P)-dependent dehydrogenase (short-subunit alcohol dehydrogenase family)
MKFTEAFSLQGEVALVTGGGTGLGWAMAKCMAEAGAKVVIVGRRESVLREAARRIGPLATAMPCDVSRLEELPPLVERVEREVGPLSIMVNNAGNHIKKPAAELSDAEFHQVLQTHLLASFALAREAARPMLARRRGSVLFISSATAIIGVPQVIAYTASKSAMVGMVRALAVEWSGQGVRVNAILPGWIETDMVRPVLEKDPARKAKVLARTPAGRMGDPEDVGWAAVYLASRAGQFVTGASLVVDGGVTIGF